MIQNLLIDYHKYKNLYLNNNQNQNNRNNQSRSN